MDLRLRTIYSTISKQPATSKQAVRLTNSNKQRPNAGSPKCTNKVLQSPDTESERFFFNRGSKTSIRKYTSVNGSQAIEALQ